MIKLDSYYVGDAAAGCYIGHFTAEDMVELAKNRLTQIWGPDRPVIVEPPSESYWKDRVNMAWLIGPIFPGIEEDDGSHLFVIWFSKVDSAQPLADALRVVEANGGWEHQAKGYGL